MQGYNRYSYVHNNPLNATDPSGFSTWTKFRDKLRPFVGLVVGIGLSFTGIGVFAAGMIAGGLGALANGGNIQHVVAGALIGGISALAFQGVGDAFKGAPSGSAFGTNLSYGAFAEKVFAHGMVGGVMSVLQGGKFGSGFAAAGFTQAFSGAIDGIGGRTGSASWAEAGNRAARIASAAVIGGTASVMSGGKFANGAITGAFSRAFNDENHRQKLENNKANIEKRYNLLHDKIDSYFNSDSANTPMHLSDSDVAILCDSLNLKAISADHYIVNINAYIDQYAHFDSYMHSDFANYKFEYAGAVYSGSDINYIGIGMLSASYSESYLLGAYVRGWKGSEDIVSWFRGQTADNYSHVDSALYWAKYGASKY